MCAELHQPVAVDSPLPAILKPSCPADCWVRGMAGAVQGRLCGGAVQVSWAAAKPGAHRPHQRGHRCESCFCQQWGEFPCHCWNGARAVAGVPKTASGSAPRHRCLPLAPIYRRLLPWTASHCHLPRRVCATRTAWMAAASATATAGRATPPTLSALTPALFLHCSVTVSCGRSVSVCSTCPLWIHCLSMHAVLARPRWQLCAAAAKLLRMRLLLPSTWVMPPVQHVLCAPLPSICMQRCLACERAQQGTQRMRNGCLAECWAARQRLSAN